MTRPLPLARYTTALLPTPALGAGAVAYVSDAAAGAHLQYYTGSIWEPDGLVLAQIPGRLIGRQVFGTAGASTYTPTAGTTAVLVWLAGGGGSGGGVPATTAAQAALGGAGSGGGQAMKYITSAFSGVTVTVGAGGAAGTAGANPGNAGGTTSFGALVSATGGPAGLAGTATAAPTSTSGLAGGVGSGGDWNATGGAGMPGFALSVASIVGSRGGACYPFGPETIGRAGTFAGTAAATGHGNGGSGATAIASNAGALAGGAGNDGIVIVFEYS